MTGPSEAATVGVWRRPLVVRAATTSHAHADTLGRSARPAEQAAALLASVLVCRAPPQATAADFARGAGLPRPRSAKGGRTERRELRFTGGEDLPAGVPAPPAAPPELAPPPPPPEPRPPPPAARRSRSTLSYRGPHAEAVAGRIAAARSGSVGTGALDEVACLCSAAFETESPERCAHAVGLYCAALSKAALGAIRSPSIAGATAMLVSLLRHPQEECRRASLSCAARELDGAQLLRAVLRGLGGNDPSRHWQAAANSLLSLRLVLAASRGDAVERLRANSGIALVMEVWRAGGHVPDVVQECVAVTLLLSHAHTRAAAGAGAAECALGAWHRFGHDATRGSLVQGLAETMLLCLPHLAERPPALPRLATESLRTLQGVGPAPAVSWLLRALARLAADPKSALELAALGVADLALAVLADERWCQEVALRRLAAEAFAKPLAVLADSPNGRNSMLSMQSPRGPAVAPGRGTGPRPQALPTADEALEAEAAARDRGPEPTLTSAACAAALKRRLEAWRVRLGTGASSSSASLEDPDAVPALQLDADFESGSLGPVTRMGPREYEVRLLSDTAGSGAYVQWFCFRVRGMQAGEPYTFHLSNLIKPGSLFEEGCQPVLFSRRRREASGVGWAREGTDVAYYPYHDLGRRHCVSFDVRFPYDDDEVFLAHAVPYMHTDLLADLARWPMVPRKSLLSSCGGRDVTALVLGDPLAPVHVCIVARAHPGETHASWVMRGAVDFLLGGSDEASVCLTGLRWFVVPMLNPDGVVLGRTRTNLDGVDLNRHHHDDSAPETRGLRGALQDEARRSRPLAFVDIHSHSRRRGVFAIANGSDGDALVASIAARTPLLDLAGTSRPEVRPQDEGVGRVAAARIGYEYSVTLESSLCARHAAAGDQHLSLEDLLSVGQAVCLGLADLARQETSGRAGLPELPKAPRSGSASCRGPEAVESVDDDD